MKALCAMAAVGLSLMGSMDSASAQPYGGQDDGYRERDYGDRHRDYGERDRGYGDRDRGYERRDRDYGGRDRGAEYGGRESAFDDREYLRCNPDVAQAIARGQMKSAIAHYQV